MAAALLPSAHISTVNWVEVAQRCISAGIPHTHLRGRLVALGVSIQPLLVEDAEVAAELRDRTRFLGLSLGDRVCLALAMRLGVTAVTAEQAWRKLDIGISIQVIR